MWLPCKGIVWFILKVECVCTYHVVLQNILSEVTNWSGEPQPFFIAQFRCTLILFRGVIDRNTSAKCNRSTLTLINEPRKACYTLTLLSVIFICLSTFFFPDSVITNMDPSFLPRHTTGVIRPRESRMYL